MTQTIDPNSFDKEIEDAQAANPANPAPEGTEQKETVTTEAPKEEPDYREKFVNSSKEAQRLLQENKAKDERIAQLLSQQNERTPDVIGQAIPGFTDLDPEQQDSLLAYTKIISQKAREEIYADPAIAYAKQSYNENKFNNALDVVVAEFPDLLPHKSEFKAQYFNPNNVPDNIQDILESMAKVYLFDKAKDIGAREAEEAQDRIELENTTGGDRQPVARRTLADWEMLARTNPVKFAAMKKEYEEDIASGQLKE